MSTTRLTHGEMRTEKQKAYDAAVLECVKNGIKLLEEKHGPSWVENIDLRTLDLANDAQCVLGQLYGSYDLGLDALNISDFTDAKYGFDRDDCDSDYSELQACWEDMLTPKVNPGA